MKDNKLLRKLFSLGVVFLCLAGLQACSDESAQTKSSIVKTVESDGLPADAPRYVVAVDAAYAPFVFRNETGQAIGFDVDILTAIGKDQGFRLAFIPTLWDGIFTTLSSGERDIVAGGVTITPERQQNMGMSKPYINAPTLVVYTDAKLQLQQFNDLQNVMVGVQSNSVFEAKLQALNPGTTNIHNGKTLFTAFRALLNDEVQAVIGDAPVLRYYMAEYSDLGKTFHSFEYNPDGQADSFGFAVKQGNQQLLNKINLGLRNIRADGRYEAIYKKWFQ